MGLHWKERSGVVCLSVCLFLFLKDIGETKASSAQSYVRHTQVILNFHIKRDRYN